MNIDPNQVLIGGGVLLAAALAARWALKRQTERLLESNRTLSRELEKARESAELEARLREHGDSLWTPERLREHVRVKLYGRPLVVVSNREPYRHVARGLRTEWVTPASGLVTGLEPLLRACGGTWIAHGDGDRDRETADARGRLRVPPDLPQYALRRVWLGADEVQGHYAGFSNEGLWPLCHIAHVRPEFRPSDWAFYKQVNLKFAEAVLEEIASQDEPCVLVQDYHFALLPRLIKERRPDARVSLFWHIPWPNPEAFSICPWARELLDGMLGADVVGFHTQHVCNNFLDTVDRQLESRVNRARFAVKRGERETLVRPFPISVEFPENAPEGPEAARAAREHALSAAGIRPDFVAVGVDRLDYTKGIIERFRAVERMLETDPGLRGRFALFQIGAPSREGLAGYRDFGAAVAREAVRINARFGGPPSIVLLARHHSQAEIRPYFLAADVMLVTSLHDGMNLVAKEFVASRSDGGGALVLSRFTGAARELRDALIVNPYDADGVAAAIKLALAMPAGERALRMSRLRRQVRENNVYRWAADLITELAAVRFPVGA